MSSPLRGNLGGEKKPMMSILSQAPEPSVPGQGIDEEVFPGKTGKEGEKLVGRPRSQASQILDLVGSSGA